MGLQAYRVVFRSGVSPPDASRRTVRTMRMSLNYNFPVTALALKSRATLSHGHEKCRSHGSNSPLGRKTVKPQPLERRPMGWVLGSGRWRISAKARASRHAFDLFIEYI